MQNNHNVHDEKKWQVNYNLAFSEERLGFKKIMQSFIATINCINKVKNIQYYALTCTHSDKTNIDK